MPNMDEVVRKVKKALGNATAGPWADNVFEPYTTVYSYNHLTEEPDGIIAKCEHEADAHLISNAPDWLRLLIEEREQDKSWIEQHRSNYHQAQYVIQKREETLRNVRTELRYSKFKVAEQDKELEQIHNMLTEQIEARKESTLRSIEQDKEIQRQDSKLKTYDYNLQTLLQEVKAAAEALRYVRDFPYLESTEDTRTIQRHVDGILKKINQS
jgi:predicted RNase H-like nuclease (RuvC/YqgF family)